MNIEDIQFFLNSYNYDVRISKNARFIDQKVTPDVLCIVADFVNEYLKNNGLNTEFTTADILNLEYSNIHIKDIFNKPGIENLNTKNEYNKFFQQPLKTLAYANILTEEKRRKKIFFKLNQSALNILKYISIRERNSFEFLVIYLEKVILDSGLNPDFQIFFATPNKYNFKRLKDNCVNFIISNTNINKFIEPRRIFTKILNIFSFKYKIPGTRSGKISKSIITWDELMYNRINFRDSHKNKNITRFESEQLKLEINKKAEAYVRYSMNKAKNLINLYHDFSEIDSKKSDIYHIHHIYPQNEFPEFKSYTENLIKLTPGQHYEEAHLNGTHHINFSFQKLCILKKTEHIENFLNQQIEEIYSKDALINLLNSCLFTNDNNNLKICDSTSFNNIRYNIVIAYETIL